LYEFKIKQIRTSPYHAMTNGTCERFNGTMKSMLSAVCNKYTDNWDLALPWVLFAYREVPVATLGCSPFELLYGRSVSGPLTLLKSSWISDVDLNTAKQNVIDFITETRDNVKEAIDLATTHAQLERDKAKRWYDKKHVI
jgi:transposase InsO family protein